MSHVDEGTLHAYLDGELPSAERKTVDMHLAECASCRATLADERALLERASALLGAARPADRPAPPFEQLRPRRSPKRSPWHVRMPVAWAASIVLALGLGYYLHEPLARASREPVGEVGEGQTEMRKPTALLQPLQQDRRPARAAGPVVGHLTTSGPAPAEADEAAKMVASEGQRVDSAAGAERAWAVRGLVVIPPPAATPQLRNVPAAPVAQSKTNEPAALLEAIVVDGAAASGVVQLRGRATTTSWPIISRGTARTLLGTDPVGLPGLARQIRRSPANDGTVVVEQQIDSGTTIQIFQRQSGTGVVALDTSAKVDQFQRLQAQEEIAPADRLARYVGRLRVEIAGPLTADSLNKLLDQVQPLP